MVLIFFQRAQSILVVLALSEVDLDVEAVNVLEDHEALNVLELNVLEVLNVLEGLEEHVGLEEHEALNGN